MRLSIPQKMILIIFLFVFSSVVSGEIFIQEKDVSILIEKGWDNVGNLERKALNARKLTKIASKKGIYVNPETPLVTEDERNIIAESIPQVCDVHFQQEANKLLKGKYSRDQWLHHVSKCKKCCRPYMSQIITKHVTKIVNGPHVVILFDYGKSKIKNDYKIKLNKLFTSSLFKKNDKKVLLIGRASNIGSFDSNMQLSKNRVAAIKKLIINQEYAKNKNITDILFGSSPPQLTGKLAELYGINQDEIEKTIFSGTDHDGSFRVNQSVIIALY